MKNSKKVLFVFLMTVFVNNPAQSQWIHSDTICQGNVNDIIAVNEYLFACTRDGIYRSSNNGILWSKVDTGITSKEVLSFGNAGTKLLAGTFTGGIYCSSDNGAQWTDASGGLSITSVTSFAQSPIKGSEGTAVFACFHDTVYNGSVYRTTDDGIHWASVSEGITNGDTRAIVVHDTSIFIATMGGVFCSTNDGLTWESRNSGFTVPYVVALLSYGNNLFAGTMTGGAYRSTDNGSIWERINEGLTNTYVNTFTVSSDGKLFAGTGWSGVFFSVNNGLQWKQINVGLTTSQINTLAIDPDGKYIYAGTDDGVWYRPLSEIVSVQAEKIQPIPGRLYLQQNFPNPFNPSTTIRYSIPSAAAVRLSVFDYLGREVAILVDQEQSSGWKEAVWNASNISNGIYFYRLASGKFIEVKKMMLVK